MNIFFAFNSLSRILIMSMFVQHYAHLAVMILCASDDSQPPRLYSIREEQRNKQ